MKLLNTLAKSTELNFVPIRTLTKTLTATFTTAFTTVLMLLSSSLLADGKARPDERAPISVVGEHAQQAGELLFSYAFINMAMDGNLSSSHHLNPNEILVGGTNTGNYLVAPLKMNMDKHLFTLLYAPSDMNTLMMTLPYLNLSMNHLISPSNSLHPNENFTTESAGLGDIKLTSILTLEKTPKGSLLLNIGVSLPTGSIEEADTLLAIPALGKTQLPFAMQLGSGTYDLLPGFTYNRVYEKRSWGSQVSGVIRLGRNDQGYTLGNRFQAQTWHAWLINTELSFSTRFNFEEWNNIDGDDRERKLPRTINTGATIVDTLPNIDPQNQGGQRMDIGLGFNGVYGKAQHRLGIELVIPVQQSLDGPQSERDLAFHFAYQKAFN